MSSESFILLWLLLPVAAASGWFMARREQRRKDSGTPLDLPTAYFKGLNFLLNEQPDKAIEVFIKVLEVNTDTVETHLALGNLFRRRGEVERAIRIHQNLIARPTLDSEQRSLALLELGQDYFKAGLFDRAENLFTELVETRAHSEQALEMLQQIYKQEKEWDKAIEVCERLARISGESMNEVIANYLCEQAEVEVTKDNYTEAAKLARKAMQQDGNCVRASMILGDLEFKQGRYRQAIQAWSHIEKQDPVFLGEVAQRIRDAYLKMGDEKGMYQYFQASLSRNSDIKTMLTLADLIKARDGMDAAEAFVVDWLRRNPSVQGLRRLIEIHLLQAEGSAREDMTLLLGILEKLGEQYQGYACTHCGFRGRSLYWSCPGCGRWNTIKPIPEA
ncbi:MAG: lipopolysaccharide assembly protein LapB [Acidiferrobacterales bacterium]